MKKLDLKQLIREEIKNQIPEPFPNFPKEIRVTPQDPTHPVKYFILRKTKPRRPNIPTPRYITVYPRGLDDYYEVDKIDFENKTIDAL